MTSRNEHNKFAAQVSAAGKETARRRGLAKRILKGGRAVATKTVSIVTAVTLAMYGIVPAAFAVNDEEAQVQKQEQTVEQTPSEVTTPSETAQPEEPVADVNDVVAADDVAAVASIDDSGTSPEVEPVTPDIPDTPNEATDEAADTNPDATEDAGADAAEEPANTGETVNPGTDEAGNADADATTDTSPDVTEDAGADATADTSPDVTEDAGADATADTSPDVTDDAGIDATKEQTDVDEEQPVEYQAGELKTRIVTAQGYTFEVTLTYGADAQIPEGAELKVIEVNQEPSDPNWKDDPAYKHRPLKTEKFINAKTMKKRVAAIEDELNVREDEGNALFYTQLLDLSITVDGKAIKPAAEVGISIETDKLAKPNPYSEDITKAAQKAGTVMVDEAAYQDVAILRFASDNKTAEELGRIVELAAAEDPENPEDWDRVLHTTVAFDTDEMAEFAIAGIEWPGLLEQSEQSGLPEEEAQGDITLEQTLRASDGSSYKITVTYGPETGVPADADLAVSEIMVGTDEYDGYVEQAADALGTTSEDVVFARAFDISLRNPETGEEYQPAGTVDVSIALSDDDLSGYDTVDVVHINEAADKQAEVVDTLLDDGVVEFKTDGFSIYVLTGTGGQTVTPRITYTFYVWNEEDGVYTEFGFTDDQGNYVTKQTIKDGSELVVPQPTSTETQTFAGWYKGTPDSAGGVVLESSPYDFDNITITEDDAVDLYAVYKTFANVILHDQYDEASESFPVAFTRRGELETTGEGGGALSSAKVKISDLKATYASSGGANMAFFGWSETPITTPGSETDIHDNPVVAIETDEDGCISITEEKHLYPIYKEVHWLTYYAAQSGLGADYVAPASYFKDDAVPAPLPTTAMDGCVFLGWWTGTLDTSGETEEVRYGKQVTNADGSLVATVDDGGVYIDSGKLYLRSDATLYAKWEKSTTANYRIVIWKQNPSDPDGLPEGQKTYEYMESEQLSGPVGTSVSVRDEDKGKSYSGYTYARCDGETSIAEDGSTTLNVYYDKNAGYEPSGTYTLTFADSASGEGASADLPKPYANIAYGENIKNKVPDNPSRRGYDFTKWYYDPYCKIEADLSVMPDHDLTVYAGWETGWYVVTIDPNYGALYAEDDGAGTGSTWFWSSFEGECIGEYRHTTRDYVESSSGTWYYVNHSGDGAGGSEWDDNLRDARHTYYTQDPNKATEDTTFEYAPGTYSYAGWYEVNADGTETPYVFGKHTDHNTTLRLHWKKAGVYYLAYAAGEGTLDDGSTKDLLLPDGYADYASIVLTQSANAPAGYTFVGWQVRGSDSNVIHKPGQALTLHANDATRVSGKDVVYLDAVYVKVDTASIVYNANGGTLPSGVESFDFGWTYNSHNQRVAASGTIDGDAGTATVSGLVNNSKFKLSEGTNLTNNGFTLAGWSNKANYDPNDEDAELYALGGDYGVDKEEPVSLFAVWRTTVTWHKNESNATWGGLGPGYTWGDPYEYDSTAQTHSLAVNRGNSVSEPIYIPSYTGTENRLFRYWATRTGAGTVEDPYEYTEYDFSQPVTGALDLYAYWSDPVVIAAHAVDSSAETLAEKTSADDGWRVANITTKTTETTLDATSHVTAPEGYAFAFAAVASDLDSVSEDNAVTAIKYDSSKKSVCVKYAGESDFTELEDGAGIYFVYYQEKKLSISYKSMESSGALSSVESTGPTETNVDLGSYTMADQLSNPLSLVTEGTYSYYDFAIGGVDTGDDPQMNASDLSLTTGAVGAGDAAPTLKVRNTWRGFEYTTDSGSAATWVSCGYDPHLYVVYYTQQPTVVIFQEETVGTSAMMDTEFTYNVKVEQTETNGTSVTTSTLFDTSNHPYVLKNGEQQSAILFYSSVGDSQTITQTITITQTEDAAFDTTLSDGSGTAVQSNKWSYTSSGDSSTQTVTFTNTHKALPVEVHVAVVPHDGSSDDIVRKDDLRSTTESAYKLDLGLGQSAELLTALPASGVFVGDATYQPGNYVFGAALSGSDAGTSGAVVTPEALGVAAIAYEQIDGNIYELVLKDSDGKVLCELGSDELYYFYYPAPKIQYVKENIDGSFANVAGAMVNPITGDIELTPDQVSYEHEAVTINDQIVMQNQNLAVPSNGLTVSQQGNNFRMPPILDDGYLERYLVYTKLGIGAPGAEDIAALGDNVTTGLTMQLRVQNNALQYSFDGSTWRSLSLASASTVYAIYTERGYDLQLSKTVDTSASGENAIFSDSSFEVTISSLAITKESYDAEGADGEKLEATPASGDIPGTITLTVKDGAKIRIKALGHGEYTVTESGNDNYTLTANSGPIVGGTTSPVDVTDNSTLSLSFNNETKLDLINSPKAICKIGDQHFYTLQSMVDYVDTLADKTVNVEMLTDYVVPAADAIEIPSDFNLTIYTAEEGFDGAGAMAVISRTSDLANKPIFTVNGSVTFKNMILDGELVEATAPMIQSAGNLTIGAGATVQNVINSGNGGAINATSGNITVDGTIANNSASSGGAIYYGGNGTISLGGQGVISGNEATEGDGGAIYMTGGTLDLSDMSSLAGNKAENGKGGAVYAASALITIDKNSSVTNNTATEGGAIYVETGTIEISSSAGYDPPEIKNNKATSGNGGAIYIESGAVSVSGGTLNNNKAESGNGGAIGTVNASIGISDTAELNANIAKSGGAIYASSSEITVSGGALNNNKATSGNGGAISNQEGSVALSGEPSFSGNEATGGNGGAVFTSSIDATLNKDATISNNKAEKGGAIYATNGSLSFSASTDGSGQKVAPAVTGNEATAGEGGAIWLKSGSIMIKSGTLSQNKAATSGGAIHTESASFTLTSEQGYDAPTVQGNQAQSGSGGAVYSDSGAITVTAGTIGGTGTGEGNTAGDKGGAIYAGSGTVNIGAASMVGNAATSNGGAVYVGSGSVDLNRSTMTSNTATNGAAIFINSGKATFTAGTYQNNVATAGGAVGMGSTEARLTFSGNVQITSNRLGAADDAPSSNVYLDQDTESALNFAGLGSSASIGIYVPDSLTDERDVPGARFGSYTSDANVARITNDRYGFSVQKDTEATRLFWGMPINVEVRYLASFSDGFPPVVAGTQKYTNPEYYPEFSSAAISELAAELYNKYSFNPGSATAVYAVAFAEGATEYAEYVTQLKWTWKDEGGQPVANPEWRLTKRDGTTVGLGTNKIIIYYAEPAYINIENNTNMTLAISDMFVNNTSVINGDRVAGYGTVYAKNGAIRTALLPVTAADMTLTARQSINLLIPGGRSMSYTLDGSFATSEGGSVPLRRTGQEQIQLSYGADGSFDQITGTTLSGSGTYSIIFGEDKVICKVVDAGGVEHPYGKISDALDAITSRTIQLENPQVATIQMVTDYLLPASDKVEIPRGYDITLTTAEKEGCDYPYTGEGDRATLSRDSENTNSMIESFDNNPAANDGTVLRLQNLVIDGKAVQGNSDGGAVKTKYCNVYVDTVDFKNVYAGNGGALLVVFNFNINSTTTQQHTVAGSTLDVRNSNFTGCNSTRASSGRMGGGAIVTNAETLTMDSCNFTSCFAGDQAGAVFHRIDYDDRSWTTINNCTFTNCRAKAAGGLELDSKYIEVTDTHFINCVATERNGGGFNAYMVNSASPSADTTITLSGCSFTNCQAYTSGDNNKGFGGGFRSTGKTTTIENCTFTNCTSTHGGAVSISNTNATGANIKGCEIDGCSATSHGGGIYYAGKDLTIEDYTDPDTGRTTRTSITNCTTNNQGGGVYYLKGQGFLTINNATITGNSSTSTSNSNARGGGVYVTANNVTITGGSISNNSAVREGGGLYINSKQSLTVTGTTISGNTSTNANGGGIWCDPGSDTVPVKIISCTMENNTCPNGNGGGIWTNAGKVTIGKDPNAANGTVIRDCSAKSGGGIYQDKNTSGTSLEIIDSSVSNCRATNGTNGVGGGIRANAWTVAVSGSTISNNTATSNGGGLWLDGSDANKNSMSLAINGSTIDGNTSGGSGGGIYTLVKTVTVNSEYADDGGQSKTKDVSISNNTAATNGGGIYHDRGTTPAAGSVLTVTGTEANKVVINGNKANGTGNNGLGGGVYARVSDTSFTWADISDNTSSNRGGGIYNAADGTGYSLTIDHADVTNNKSSNQGGGIFTNSQLYFKNGSMVSGNRLTGNTVGNAAGVYLKDGRTFYVGSAGSSGADSSSIKDNYVASGAPSNLRLWWNSSSSENNSGSVHVYCSLSGDIGVVNAAQVGTWFGSLNTAGASGFSEDNHVFHADTSTLYGIIDRTDPDKVKIIWAGPPIAKITDGSGNLLYLGPNTPAIFDRLYSGNEGVVNTIGAFNVLNGNVPGEGVPELYTASGKLYKGETGYCVKMLVENYASDNQIFVKGVEGRNVTFTTAGTTDSEYPAAASRATVTAGNITRTLLSPRGNLAIENIVLDGDNRVRVLWEESTISNAVVTLGAKAVIQNGYASRAGSSSTSYGGGGVYASSGTFVINGGVIRGCVANDGNNGGAAYVNGGTFDFQAGNITACTTSSSGGGVFLNGGVFNMSGGTISGCSAKKGGGVIVPNKTASPFNMSGGSIVNNVAMQEGGGIAISGTNSRINFSKKVTVSGNKATKDGRQVACNVELNADSNEVINTNYGGILGGSYIGVYVPGAENAESLYGKHGVERKPFGTFADEDKTTTFYSFVNDRNGLKGGIIEEGDLGYQDNTIYWIKIFSLRVENRVEAGNSTTIDENEPFLYKVTIRGKASVTGQPGAAQIDSSTGEYGEMYFNSNGEDATTAVFMLKDGESATSVNLSDGLTYEVVEYLIVSGGPYENQQKRYAAMPMNDSREEVETLTYGGTTYTVVQANFYTSKIGENKNRTDVDPYTSVVKFTNLMPVCKITTDLGVLLYKPYVWEKITNNPDDPGIYYAPAVYTELTGDNGAFEALENDLFSDSSGKNSYSVENGMRIEMLIGSYMLTTGITLPASVNGTVTLTTAPSTDALFPKQDKGTTSQIKRDFENGSMFDVSGNLAVESIILDGMKGSFTTNANGGIANVPDGGSLTIRNNAKLQNSKTSVKGGAVYVASGGTVSVVGGVVNRNESDGDGAGIYVEQGGTLNLSGDPSFGGSGLDRAGNIYYSDGNWKNETLYGKNGGKMYNKPRQDIYLAETGVNPSSIVLTGNLASGAGTIWVWAATDNHYAKMKPFAVLGNGSVSSDTYLAFRNARPDSDTNNEGSPYITGSAGSHPAYVYWSGGFDVSFNKIDGYGALLAGATFTLYTDSACTNSLSGADATSADGTDAFKDKNGQVIPKGEVLFEEVPSGTFYMKEDNPPTGYASNNNVYIVLVGSAALAEAPPAAKANLAPDAKSAVFLYEDGVIKAAPNINGVNGVGILNESEDDRKVILKKTNGTGPLKDAQFQIHRVDMSLVQTDIDGDDDLEDTFTSDATGAFWMGMLPYGCYYLHEIKLSDGTGSDLWLTIRVDANGVTYLDGDNDASNNAVFKSTRYPAPQTT